MERPVSLALLLLMSASPGCGRDPAPDQPRASRSTPTPATTGPWRFVPTLEQHLPAGAVAEPILELSLPRVQTVIVLAAVLRQGSPSVNIERWTFEQTPGEESLSLVEGGQALLRLRPGPRHQELAELRRQLATPRAVLTRPLGLGDEPRATLDQLTAALSTLGDPASEGRARVQAAATVVRGLDDAVVLERDAIWELDDLLDPTPPVIEVAIEVSMLSERRARATLTRQGHTATLELQRKTEGWAVAAIDAWRAPAPPEPTRNSGGTSIED
ncbi:MAG: hypothetical protein AAGF11_47825 [Myxococcota bacterium]